MKFAIFNGLAQGGEDARVFLYFQVKPTQHLMGGKLYELLHFIQL